MPRVVRDSDEDVESKTVVRRTRASSAASSVDSPVRRTTRSNKQLSIIESSPESLDDSNTQRTGRATRSRTATLDKAASSKNLRSRKNSASSDQSESVIDVESEVTQKRVTRKNTSALSVAGTPTKANLRSRSIRAGSEAKSTPPPTRSKRVTRASSVDPISLNESAETPVKRRTRASMVPVQPTVTEEQEAKNKPYKSLENTVIEIDEDDSAENVTVSKKEKTNKKSKTVKEVEENTSIVTESINNSEKSTLEPPSKMEDSLIDKSCTSIHLIEVSTVEPLTIRSVDNIVESSTSNLKTNAKVSKTINVESSVVLKHENLVKKLNNLSNVVDKVELDNCKDNINVLNIDSEFNDDECEIINIDDSTESTLTDDLIVQVDSPEKDKNKITVDNFKVDIKDAYVKLNRTNMIEKILTEKVDEIKNNAEDIELTSSNNNNISQNSVITNAKTAIVLVNDFVKSNENLTVKLSDTENISSINDLKDQINFDLNDKIVPISVDVSKADKLNVANEKINVHDCEKENSIYTNESENNEELEVCLLPIENIQNNLEKSISYDNPISNNLISIATNKNISIKESSVVLNDLNNDDKYSTLINKNIIRSENYIVKETNEVLNREITNACDDENGKFMSLNKTNDEMENLILVDENSEEADHFMDVDSSNNELKNSSIAHINNDESNAKTSLTIDVQSVANNDLQHSSSEHKNNDKPENIILIDEDSNDEENVEAMDISDNNDLKNSFNTSKHNGESENLIANQELLSDSNIEYKNNESKNSIYINISNREHSLTKALSNDNINSSMVNININKIEELKDSASANQLRDNINEIKNSISTANKNENIADANKIEENSSENENLSSSNTLDNATENLIPLNEMINNKGTSTIVDTLNDETKNSILPVKENEKNNKSPTVRVDYLNSTSNKIDKPASGNSFDNATETSPCTSKIGSSLDARDTLENSNFLVEDTNSKAKDSTTLSQVDVETNTSMCIDESNNDTCPNKISKTTESVSMDKINNEIADSHSIYENTNIACAATVKTECKSQLEIDKKSVEFVPENGANNVDNGATSESMDIPLNDFNRNDETANFHIHDETNFETNQTEPQLCEVDKNSHSSAVTDADGENASSPEKADQSKDDSSKESSPSKSPKEQKQDKQKHKGKSYQSESEDNDENLFQDVLPEEYTSEKSTNELSQSETLNGSENQDKTANDSIEGKQMKKSRKSADKKVLNKSQDPDISNANDTASQGSNDSLSKKSGIDDDSELQESANKTVIENADVGDEHSSKTPNKSRRSANKSLELDTSSSKQKKDESVSEKLSDSLNENKSNKNRKSLDKSASKQNQNNSSEESSSENKSPNKSRKSLDKSARLNQSSSEEKHDESVSQTLDENKSLNKSRKSLDKSTKLDESTSESTKNESASEKLSTSLNNSKLSKRQSVADESRKSLSENQTDEPIEDEPMEVDEPMDVDEIDDENENENVNDESPNKSRKFLDKSQLNKSKNESISEKLSTSLNKSKTSKGTSLDNSKSNLSRISIVKQEDDEHSSNSECEEKFPVKSRKSLEKDESQDTDDTVKETLSTSLNDSKKSKRLSQKLQSPKESSRKSLIKQESEEIFSDNEEDQAAEKSLNKSNKKDKSLRETSLRKSLSKSIIASNGATTESSDSETDLGKKLNKSTNKSLNVSKKSLKSANTSIINSPAKASIKENGEDIDTLISTADSKKDNQSENVLDASLQKNIERMKYCNPMKHDVSTVAQIDSDSDDVQSFQHIFQLDSDETEESNDEVKEVNSEDESIDEDDQHKSIDSDIAREYNLAGKDVIKYSDDDVPGDDCRASEEESSDPEDEGDDLADFVVPDEEVEEDGSEDEEDEVDDDEENEEEGDVEDVESVDEEELDVVESKKDTKEKSINLSKSIKDKSINDSKSFNKSANHSKSRLLDIVNSESDDDDDDDEIENEVVVDKSLKNKSANSSNLLKNKSLNNSKSVKEKSTDLSKSILSTSKTVLNSSKSAKIKSVTISESQPTEESNSEDEQVNRSQKLKSENTSLTESDSAPEKGEDSYRIITTNSINTSNSKVQSKKLGCLIECSTPKPGVTKKNAESFVDKNSSLSITNKTAISARRKSGSLDNLADTKLINSRLSIGSTKAHDSSKIPTDVDTVGTPEAVLKNRQSWKLVPLNKTMQTAGDDTPLTKFLKKAKLNDSVPILQSMKSGSLSDNEEPKKNDALKSLKRKSLTSKSSVNAKEAADTEVVEHVGKKSKKRKLQDISYVTSLDDESMINIVGKKKKRARIEESIVLDEEVEQMEEPEQVQEGKKKKKKNRLSEAEKQAEAQPSDEPEIIEDEKVKKKKKKNKLKVDIKEEIEKIPESTESQEVKQKKKKKSLDAAESESVTLTAETVKPKKKKSLDAVESEPVALAAETVKPKKKKSRLSDEKVEQEHDLTVKVEKPKKKKSRLSDKKVEQEHDLAVEVEKPKKKKSRLSDEKSDQENWIGEVLKVKKKSKLSSDSESIQMDKKSKKKKKTATAESDNEAPDDVGFDEARRSALISMQQADDSVQALKMARKKKHQEHAQRMLKQEPVRKNSLKRLPEDILDGLTDEPVIRQPHKRQKLSKTKERNCVIPSTSMFSPGKPVPVNLKVDDDYIELSDAGGTTQFGVVNLAKAQRPKLPKTSIAALTFREKMLARNQRQPVSAYHVYLKKQKAKSGL